MYVIESREYRVLFQVFFRRSLFSNSVDFVIE